MDLCVVDIGFHRVCTDAQALLRLTFFDSDLNGHRGAKMSSLAGNAPPPMPALGFVPGPKAMFVAYLNIFIV